MRVILFSKISLRRAIKHNLTVINKKKKLSSEKKKSKLSRLPASLQQNHLSYFIKLSRPPPHHYRCAQKYASFSIFSCKEILASNVHLKLPPQLPLMNFNSALNSIDYLQKREQENN